MSSATAGRAATVSNQRMTWGKSSMRSPWRSYSRHQGKMAMSAME